MTEPSAPWIITIDGPAGAGKSTVARELAHRLGFDFLDTGAMYRIVTLAAQRAGVDPSDEPALAQLLETISIRVAEGKSFLDGEDVSSAIRTPEVTTQVQHYADRAAVRKVLTQSQRAIGAERDLVTEGRDQGTLVFPHAQCKFFLTASEDERARRRHADLARMGRLVPVDEILASQRSRDEKDERRALAPLHPATDANLIDTSNLTLEQVVDLLETHVRLRIGGGDPRRTGALRRD